MLRNISFALFLVAIMALTWVLAPQPFDWDVQFLEGNDGYPSSFTFNPPDTGYTSYTLYYEMADGFSSTQIFGEDEDLNLTWEATDEIRVLQVEGISETGIRVVLVDYQGSTVYIPRDVDLMRYSGEWESDGEFLILTLSPTVRERFAFRW